MNIFKKFSFLVILLVPFFLFANRAEAAENQFITIVNPVRVSSYNPNPAASLESEYGVIFRNNLPATWLLTFDIISNGSAAQVLKKFNNKQELGIFLEVTPKFAEAAGVKYHNAGFWHFANAVFLSGYTQEERIKLIDAVFAEFKQVFGYYPTSVGSWWTDSYSLSYMKDRYGVTANLGCSDQFSTDGYQIWGQYWSTPFYPSKYHTGVPALSKDNKLDVVVLQWAPRDPLNGYSNSTYSTQDYFTTPKQPIDYFEKLVKLYASQNGNKFGQVTVGLEGDFTPEAYKGEYAKQMGIVSKLVISEGYRVTNMGEFSNWYRKTFPELSPARLIESDDLLGGNKKAVWFQSPHYRLGYIFDKATGEIKIRDFRAYFADLIEPYYQSPNSDINLSIYIPSIFDEINYGKDSWTLPKGSEIIFSEASVVIKGKGIDIPQILQKYPGGRVKKLADGLEVSFADEWEIPKDGVSIKDYSAEAVHFFRQKKAVLYLLTGKGWNYFRKIDYSVSQGEMYALFRLSTLAPGKVLVANEECLQCSWHTQFRHPAFANQRGYVKRFGGHPIVYDPGVLTSKDRANAKKIFDRLNVKYIYLVKFEGYMEKLPFSPGDLGVEKIFSNANSEIWEVKN